MNLPGGLQTLTFGPLFNQNLECLTLPSGLQHLTFGASFNQSLAGVTLPSSLQSLTFDRDFNFRLQGVTFPENLRSLTFGRGFDQSLEGLIFPSSLETLLFGSLFNQPLTNVNFPSSLRSLTFGTRFNLPIDDVILPRGLQSLSFGQQFNRSLEHFNWPSLQSFWFLISSMFNHFHLCIVQPPNWDDPTWQTFFLDGWTEPPGLMFGSSFNQSLERVDLPMSLESLCFGHHFNQSLEAVRLPVSLKTLVFGSDFNQSLEGVTLPSGLETLKFGQQFQQPLETLTLPSLRSLTLDRYDVALLEAVQCPQLQCLECQGVLLSTEYEDPSERWMRDGNGTRTAWSGQLTATGNWHVLRQVFWPGMVSRFRWTCSQSFKQSMVPGPCRALKDFWEFKPWFPSGHVSCVVKWFLSMGPVLISPSCSGWTARRGKWTESQGNWRFVGYISRFKGWHPSSSQSNMNHAVMSVIRSFHNLTASTFQKPRSVHSWLAMSTIQQWFGSEFDIQWIQSKPVILWWTNIAMENHHF